MCYDEIKMRRGEHMKYFTNYDAQQILDSQAKLVKLCEQLKSIKQGSHPDIVIHAYALKTILDELRICRDILANR